MRVTFNCNLIIRFDDDEERQTVFDRFGIKTLADWVALIPLEDVRVVDGGLMLVSAGYIRERLEKEKNNG